MPCHVSWTLEHADLLEWLKQVYNLGKYNFRSYFLAALKSKDQHYYLMISVISILFKKIKRGLPFILTSKRPKPESEPNISLLL